jgi:uncharacterized radical SAM superfamily Fe-S cluster-containing enzyme
MAESKVHFKTWSICPICLKRLPAERVRVENEVYLQKTCAEHGFFRSLIWRGIYDLNEWIGDSEKVSAENPQCPDNCGLCADHQQKTCCIILNVTGRCNLNCRFCFADHGCEEAEPTLDELKDVLLRIIDKDKTLVQLSGGEPTTRNDLPEIIREAKKAGAKYVQLNSNGLRLSEDKEYVRKLAEAGLSFVFMQFDGTDDGIYSKLRGKPLLDIKKQAIVNCAEFSIGVTLVATLVRDVNMGNIGEILNFALAEVPNVRGVHFQPVSYMGRMNELPTDYSRITMDELLFEIQQQTGGVVQANNLLPSSCDHPLCGFHGDFVVNNHELVPLLRREKKTGSCCCSPAAAEKNREFVARRWLRPIADQTGSDSCCGDLRDMNYFVKRVSTHGFTITSMAFQDAGNLDFSRLRQCSLHVYDRGKVVPFCSYYLTGWTM